LLRNAVLFGRADADARLKALWDNMGIEGAK
jgi:hypothetical protein